MTAPRFNSCSDGNVGDPLEGVYYTLEEEIARARNRYDKTSTSLNFNLGYLHGLIAAQEIVRKMGD